jgi:uncharacterized protein YbaR (Trm112 family)/ubiquinone/menaquinone biosynthesis C-methylase UbiE
MNEPQLPIDPFVQEWIAGTNGRLYKPVVGKLKRYPIPDIPIPPSQGGLLLDIGAGWGRWMVAAAKRGYVPVGIDIKHGPAAAARRVTQLHGFEGYSVVADLGRLPFADGVFDRVFSYSVIQHTHRDRARACVGHVHRILKTGGGCTLEFPISEGLGHRLRGDTHRAAGDDDWSSWSVRLYTRAELEALFAPVFGNFATEVDCYFGIGVQWSDVDVLPWYFRPIPAVSEALRLASKSVEPLARLADSLYVVANKTAKVTDRAPTIARTGSNLDVLAILRCPVSGTALEHDRGRSELVSRAAGLAYPIVDDIPNMIPEEARKL